MGCVRVGLVGGVVSFRYFEAPDPYEPQEGDPPAVFLAGGISGCPDWHSHAVHVLRDSGVPMVVLNPARKNFPITDPNAGWEQVSWEQHHLHLPGLITLMWFPRPHLPVTVQPIAQFEFGQASDKPDRTLVIGADPDYPRQLDVHHMMRWNRPDETVHATLDDVLTCVIGEVIWRS